MDSERISAALERAGRPGAPRVEVLAPRRLPALRRLGIVSGSFDPITVAHVAVAAALVAGGADLTLLLYSAGTLPKDGGGRSSAPLLSAEDRVASVVAVSRAHPELGAAVCSHGLLADQAEAVARRFPGAAVVMGMGSDKVRQLFDPRWYGDPRAALERLFALAEVVYALRAGDDDPGDALEPGWRSRLRRVDLPPAVAGISSTSVRDRLRAGGDVSALVPAEARPFLPVH